MPKHTYYHKDGCRIYWRIEFTLNEVNDEWEFEVFRSLEDHEDPEAHEVFHGSTPNLGGTPDVMDMLGQFTKYYTGVIFQMARHLSSAYKVKVE